MALQKRVLSKAEFSEFKEALEGYELPSIKLAKKTISASETRLIQFTSEESSEELYVAMMAMNSHIVNNEEPEEVEAAGIVYNKDEDRGWYVPPEKTKEIQTFPTLNQAYYEGNSYKDREATHRYHFDDGTKLTAIEEQKPISRLDRKYIFTKIKSLGGFTPQKWVLGTENGDYMYLRERSGHILLYDSVSGYSRENLIFDCYIGGEHPGTHLKSQEVISILDSMEYFEVAEDYKTDIPDRILNEFH